MKIDEWIQKTNAQLQTDAVFDKGKKMVLFNESDKTIKSSYQRLVQNVCTVSRRRKEWEQNVEARKNFYSLVDKVRALRWEEDPAENCCWREIKFFFAGLRDAYIFCCFPCCSYTLACKENYILETSSSLREKYHDHRGLAEPLLRGEEELNVLLELERTHSALESKDRSQSS